MSAELLCLRQVHPLFEYLGLCDAYLIEGLGLVRELTEVFDLTLVLQGAQGPSLLSKRIGEGLAVSVGLVAPLVHGHPGQVYGLE